MQTLNMLPFFVYGTLRPGEGNYSYFLRGRTYREETGILKNAKMYGRSGFPYALESDSSNDYILGTLVWVYPRLYGQVKSALDNLEGYGGPYSKFNHYNRIQREVQGRDKKINAWFYVAGDESFVEGLPRISSGDWLQNIREISALRKQHEFS